MCPCAHAALAASISLSPLRPPRDFSPLSSLSRLLQKGICRNHATLAPASLSPFFYPAIPGNCFSATVPRQKSHRFSGIERFNENALESARQEFSSASRRVPLEFPTGCEREKLSQVKNDSENLETDAQRRI